ncbi:MAG: ATP-binding cassette domain-containing protein [Rhodospirillaceae bacterium]|nr:ATP-binding cassette domain-containing protein [Rhodospirillaceae bacterium]
MARPPFLSLRNASIGFGGTPLFERLTLHLARGDMVSLVGRNGCGKSTLMKLVAGELDLDAGERYEEPSLSIAYLAQQPKMKAATSVFDWVSVSMARGAAQDNQGHAVEAMLSALDLDGARDVTTLSGGEQRRAALAQVFVARPDLMLLDEPTNHLDISTVQWLENAMRQFKGAALVISHDRTFLANVTNRILWLQNGHLRGANHGFGAFDDWCEQVLENEAREARKLDARLREEARWLLRGVTARRRRNQGRLRKLEVLRASRAALLSETGRIRAKIDDGQARSKLVVEAREISKSFQGETKKRPVVSKFSTRIRRGDRIGIIGANGTGKTTLLKLLIGEIRPDSGHVRVGKALTTAYFDQQRSLLNPKETLKSTLCESGGDLVQVGDQVRHVRGYLKDWLFDPREAEARVATLSGGQRNRLMLAKILATPSDLLVLDEPTNDLDMDTLDLLQDLLSEYPGTVLLVSHDRDFLDKTVSSTIVLEGDGHIREYAGGYTDHLSQRKEAPSRARMLQATPAKRLKSSSSPEPPKATTRLSYKEQRELDQLSERMTVLEREIAELEAELSDQALFTRDPGQFSESAGRLETARAELAESEDRWLILEMQREEVKAARSRIGSAA